jgi:hypothetical protein
MAQEGEREYVPFVEEGKVWYCGYWHPNDAFPSSLEDPGGEGIDCIFSMCGDTLISEMEYKKVYCQFEEYYGDREQHYYCSVREEAYQVFIVENETKEEKLLYDFSLPGEIITLTYNDLKFARTEGWRRYSFLPGQLEYTVCIFSGSEIDHSNAPGFWVDGVGAPSANPFAFEFSTHLFDQPEFGKYISVRSCLKDGKYIFNIDWMVEPMVPTFIDNRNHTENSQNNSHLYDLQGRHLSGQPRHGIYIKNKKKSWQRKYK